MRCRTSVKVQTHGRSPQDALPAAAGSAEILLCSAVRWGNLCMGGLTGAEEERSEDQASMTHPRRREWFVFDDRGNIWPAHSPELRRQLYCFSQNNDLALGLARNLGFVAGCQSGSNVAVRLQLDLVSDIALAAAYYWLSDCEPRRWGPQRHGQVLDA